MVLYEILTGELPFPLPREARHWTLREKLKEALKLRERPLQWVESGPPIPQDLKQLCNLALHPDQRLRLQTAQELSSLLVDYLDGVGRREKGLEKVKEAELLISRAERLTAKAQSLGDEGDRLNRELKSTDPEEKKQPVWALLDEAEELNKQVNALEYEAERTLYDALLFDDQLKEAHTLLAMRAKTRHCQLEDQFSFQDGSRLLSFIKRHLPYVSDLSRAKLEAYLSPEGPVSIAISAAKTSQVVVNIQPYLIKSRRMVLGDSEPWLTLEYDHDLGIHSIRDQSLTLGKIPPNLQRRGHEDMLYPIRVNEKSVGSAAVLVTLNSLLSP